jgi:signal transduction histidine kinase
MAREKPGNDLSNATPRAGFSGFALAVLVLLASSCLVLLAWRAARDRELRSAQDEFTASCTEVTELLSQRLVNYELTIRGGVALFATVARPSPQQWRAFVDGLELPQRFPALTGLGFAVYTSSHGLEQLQVESRAAGYGLLTVWPHGVREFYGPILYLEPRTEENLAVIGFDMLAEPTRSVAMRSALDTGQVKLSGRVRLLQDRGDAPGMLMYAPVYRAGDAPLTPAARRESMQGWVYVPIRAPRFVDAALQPTRRLVRFRLVDVTDGTPTLLYADPDFTPRRTHGFTTSLVTEQYGRRWRYDFVSGPIDAAAPGLATLRTALVVGLLASLLLFGIAWSLAHTEARAQRIAARMTEAHRRSEARVLALNRSLEARVDMRTRELSEANRELESFSYSVSHDLRAPLRAIEGFARVLDDRYGNMLDEAGRDYLQRVRSAAARMSELIESMLKLARVGRGEIQREPLDLSRMAREIFAELRAAQPGREVEVEIAPDLRATGDTVLVRALLHNLLGNAWKFTRDRAHPRIVFAAGERGGEPAFYVRDNGIGFSQAYAGKLFRPFQRVHADEAFAGEGIGLASVKRIVERHGGNVAAEGKEGEGATFWFTLPE